MTTASPIKKTWRLAVAAVALMAALFTVAQSGPASASVRAQAKPSLTASSHGPLKVALILDGSAHDGDYNQLGYTDFEAAIRQFGSRVEATVEQNIPEGPTVAPLVDGLIGSGYTLFFIHGTGYETYLKPVAQAHPQIRIEEFESAVTARNYGAYNIDIAQSAYLGGMMLAAASKTGHLGIVASFPFPGILTQINGVELGAKAIKPRATLHVLFVSSFYDPAKEGQAAQALISAGADGIVDIQNDPAACETAQRDHVPCVGQTLVNGPSYGPTTYLADFRFIWTPIYKQVLSDVLAKRSVPKSIFAGYPQGATGLGPFGRAYNRLVPAPIRAKIAAKAVALRAGKFHVYEGPLVDQQGQVKVRAGHRLTVSQILSLNWVVKGVIGNVKV